MTLPNRRQVRSGTTEYRGQKLHITLGLYPDGTPGEIWAYGYKTGSGQEAEINQQCIQWSKLVQEDGKRLEDFAKYISMDYDGQPHTASGAALLFALEMLNDHPR